MKTIKVLILIILTTCCNFANAYVLNGVMKAKDEGRYFVVLQNENGHLYQGIAVEKDKRVLVVSVEDINGQSYSGTALRLNEKNYMLNLYNDSTNGEVIGMVSLMD